MEKTSGILVRRFLPVAGLTRGDKLMEIFVKGMLPEIPLEQNYGSTGSRVTAKLQ